MKLETFWNKFDTLDPSKCWIWQASVDGGGYGHLRYEERAWKSHRLSYTLLRGEIPVGMNLCHSCDTPRCGNPDHLFLGTCKDNAHDMMKKNRAAWDRLLSPQDVYDIRSRRFYLGETISEIAKDYPHVHQSTILNVAEAYTRKDNHPFCDEPATHVIVGRGNNAIYVCDEHWTELTQYGDYILTAKEDAPYTCRFIE